MQGFLSPTFFFALASLIYHHFQGSETPFLASSFNFGFLNYTFQLSNVSWEDLSPIPSHVFSAHLSHRLHTRFFVALQQECVARDGQCAAVATAAHSRVSLKLSEVIVDWSCSLSFLLQFHVSPRFLSSFYPTRRMKLCAQFSLLTGSFVVLLVYLSILCLEAL